jgi:rhamnulokinase
VNDLTVAAVDLGAESGRVAAAHFDGKRIDLAIVHRFANQSVRRNEWLEWDAESMWREISSGLSALGKTTTVASVGVDAWGLDFGLYDSSDELIGSPTSYRDAHRVEAFERAIAEFGGERIYNATGIQLMEINSIFGLLADARHRPDVLATADLLLMMPDIFHNKLSGSIVTELSAASTTGMFDIAKKRWVTELLDDMGLPTRLLPEVAPAGTDIGAIIGDLATGGLAKTRVVLPSAHDTASAILAIPNASSDTLFISSGTWSLVGVVLDSPIVTRESRLATLTNEGGYGDTVRFLRNVMGLWVLQECRRQWQTQGVDVSYEALVLMAEEEDPLVSVIDLNATEFLAPGNMPKRIQDYCSIRGISVPVDIGQVVRTIIDSLALSYRTVLEDIQSITGVPITSIAVVGGGGENALLQKATALATGLPVVCWAREATALGNAGAQLRALGELHSVEQIWDVVAASTQTRTFEPQKSEGWDSASTKLRDQERAEQARRGLGDFDPATRSNQEAGA